MRDLVKNDRQKMLSWSIHISVLVLYLIIGCVLTYPLISEFGTAVYGGPIARADAWQNVWAGWWSSYALTNGLNPFYTPMLYAPQGTSLVLQTLNLPNGLMSFPVQLLFGPVAGYNFAVLLGFMLSGYTAFLLVHRISQDWLASAVAGAVFTALPFHVAKFYDGQLEHVSLQWLPLYALALLLVMEQITWKRVLLWFLALALVSYTSWYYTFFCVAYTGVSLIWLAWGERRLKDAIIVGLIYSAITVIVVLPALWTVLQSNDAMRPAAHWIEQARESSADLVEFFLPSALHPWWGEPIQRLQEGYHPNNTGWLIAPGYAALIVALYGAIREWRSARLWILLLASMSILALGGSLKVAGYDTGIPLPYRLFEVVPGANLGRRPSHFAALAYIPLVVLIGLALRDWRQKLPAKYPLLVVIFAIVAAIEYTPRPKERTALDVSPTYESLYGEDGTIFDVPANAAGLDDLSDTLKHQMVHYRPIMGGYVSRRPDYWLNLAPGIRQLWRLRCAEDPISDPTPQALNAFNYYGVRTIVLDTTNLSVSKADCGTQLLTDWGLVARPSTDPSVIAYDVPLQEASSFTYLSEGWHLPDSTKDLWRWMGARGNLIVVNATDHATTMMLQFTLESYRIPRTVQVISNEQILGEFTVTPGQARVYRLPIESKPGDQLLSLHTDAEPDPAPDAERLISIAISQVELTVLPVVEP
jgi:hypothetical protein